MAAECEVCHAVSAGGRIRVVDEMAQLMLDLLAEYRRGRVNDRRFFIEFGKPESLEHVNAELKMIDRQVEEIERTAREMGWSDGQPQRSHP